MTSLSETLDIHHILFSASFNVLFGVLYQTVKVLNVYFASCFFHKIYSDATARIKILNDLNSLTVVTKE